VLRVLRGELTSSQAAQRNGLSEAQVDRWRDRFLAGATDALTEEAPARPGPAHRVYDSIADAVGHTPLVRLGGFAETACEVFAKVEFLNPMGSVKDRVARHMIRKAAADGRLNRGDVIVEASSGNTAMGLGMMAVLGGYRCKVVVRDRTSREKVASLRALGVEVETVDGTLPPEHPDSYNRVMERVVTETPDCYYPDQHNNRENNEAHYLSTGPEIWEQMGGAIDYFVAGMGTGGTISGVARYLKEQDPSIKVVGVDVEGSIFTDYFKHGRLVEPKPYLLEGLGDEEPIGCPEFELIDDMIQVSSRDAFHAARQLARSQAILAGGSSGAALLAVRELTRRLGDRPARVVTLFPDSGTRYLTTFYDDAWLAEKGAA
jgi:cystathionine beta-synthase